MKNNNRIYLIILAFVLFAGCEQVPTFELPKVVTLEATEITDSSVVVSGRYNCDVKDGLYVKRGFEFSNSPDNLDLNPYLYEDEWVSLTGEKDVAGLISGLQSNTKYYYRAALFPLDTKYSAPIYGETLSFTTPAKQESVITVTTLEAQSVTSRTARIYASCTYKNATVSKVGFVGSLSSTRPTISSNDWSHSFNQYLYKFDIFIYSLSPGQTVYFRAYALDSDGNAHYGEVISFTTKTEPGGLLTQYDFIGTYTVTANSPWEEKDVTWADVQIVPDNGDTVVAIGWIGRDELRAVGAFDKGMQVVRFESGWYFESLTFDVDGKKCVAVFTPAYYSASDKKAYRIETGGRGTNGEVWLSRTSTNNYALVPSDGDSNEGYYANGFVFDYYSLVDWEHQGNSNVYTNVKMVRTSPSTTKYLPSRNGGYKPVLFNLKIKYEEQNHHYSVRVAACQ